MPFHAFLGITIMGPATVLAIDWYRGFDRSWGPSPADDQESAGGLLWASGDIVALIVLAPLFVQWSRASEREAPREDRRLDRLEAARGAVPAGGARQDAERAGPPG
jgi:putative copper resistance protein D